VLFIEQIGKSLYIKKDSEYVVIPGRMRDLSNELKEPFFQCHSYLMINIERVTCMKKGQIFFDNGTHKYLGRDSFAEARKGFNNYLLGQ